MTDEDKRMIGRLCPSEECFGRLVWNFQKQAVVCDSCEIEIKNRASYVGLMVHQDSFNFKHSEEFLINLCSS